MNILAIDLGKTGCRVVRQDRTGRHWHGQGSGAVGMAHPDGPQSALRAIEAAVQAGSVPDEELQVVCLGAAGVAAAPQAATHTARLLANRFGARALVTSDSVTSHAGALGGGPGVVLAVGTGAVAITFDDDGDLVQVDGWGQTLGDEGSGWWIGREGLIAACRDADGRGPRTGLRQVAQEDFADLRHLPVQLGDATAAIPVLAAFAPRVLIVAEDGDAVARQILARAARALGTTAAAAARRAGAPDDPAAPVQCCLIGGLAHWPQHFRAAVRRAARESAGKALEWISPAGTSLDGAALVANHADLPHRSTCASAAPEPAGPVDSQSR